MDKVTFLTKVKAIMGLSESSIQADEPLPPPAEWDSLIFLELMTFFEVQLNTPVPYDKLEQVDTLNDLWQLAQATSQ